MKRLAEDKVDWVVGLLCEGLWSKVAQPDLHSFSQEDEPLRLMEQSVEKGDLDPEVICC